MMLPEKLCFPVLKQAVEKETLTNKAYQIAASGGISKLSAVLRLFFPKPFFNNAT